MLFKIIFLVFAVALIAVAGIWSWKSDNSGKKKMEELNKEKNINE